MIDREYNEILNEYIDMSGTDTIKYLSSFNEADKNQLLLNLTGKLYDKIVAKIDDINFGIIPKTNGDIRKLENYESMKECIDIIREIVLQYGHTTEPLDQVSTAMYNIEQRERLFAKCYALNIEMGIVLYNTMVLAIVRSVSLMIATSIEFVKSTDNISYNIALDKIAYTHTSESLLFNNLRRFNQACNKNEVDKVLNELCKASSKSNFVGTIVGIGLLSFVIFHILLKVILPLLRDLVYIFYASKQSISDYFAIQAELLEANAISISYRKDMDTNKRKDIITKQMKIADKMKKISNAFTVDMNIADKSAINLQKDEKQKYKLDMNVHDGLPQGGLF